MEVIEIIMYLIMYDINTETSEGKKRLRNIAQYCLIYSQRVQNSVYECNVAYGQFLVIKEKLLQMINEEEDSIRFYNIGKNYQSKVEHYGTKPSYDLDGFIAL